MWGSSHASSSGNAPRRIAFFAEPATASTSPASSGSDGDGRCEAVVAATDREHAGAGAGRADRESASVLPSAGEIRGKRRNRRDGRPKAGQESCRAGASRRLPPCPRPRARAISSTTSLPARTWPSKSTIERRTRTEQAEPDERHDDRRARHERLRDIAASTTATTRPIASSKPSPSGACRGARPKILDRAWSGTISVAKPPAQRSRRRSRTRPTRETAHRSRIAARQGRTNGGGEPPAWPRRSRIAASHRGGRPRVRRDRLPPAGSRARGSPTSRREPALVEADERRESPRHNPRRGARDASASEGVRPGIGDSSGWSRRSRRRRSRAAAGPPLIPEITNASSAICASAEERGPVRTDAWDAAARRDTHDPAVSRRAPFPAMDDHREHRGSAAARRATPPARSTCRPTREEHPWRTRRANVRHLGERLVPVTGLGDSARRRRTRQGATEKPGPRPRSPPTTAEAEGQRGDREGLGRRPAPPRSSASSAARSRAPPRRAPARGSQRACRSASRSRSPRVVRRLRATAPRIAEQDDRDQGPRTRGSRTPAR